MYSNIVPMDLQDRLLALRDADTAISWQIGDATREVIAWNRRHGTDYTSQEIYQAVGSFVGKASRSVREYAYIASCFSQENREKYNVLSFAHFRVAATLGMQKGIEALAWAVDQTEVMGRPATVDAMYARFAPEAPGEPETPVFDQCTPMEMIYQTVTRQVNLVNGWWNYDIPKNITYRLNAYYTAAQELISELEREQVIV